MKKNLYIIIATAVIAGLNVWLFIISQSLDIQLSYVAFVIVWIDLVVSWLINKRQPSLSYMFFSTALIVEALLAVNYFWIQKSGRYL
jgi:hypothetical protein